jgi:hypothetical protein
VTKAELIKPADGTYPGRGRIESGLLGGDPAFAAVHQRISHDLDSATSKRFCVRRQTRGATDGTLTNGVIADGEIERGGSARASREVPPEQYSFRDDVGRWPPRAGPATGGPVERDQVQPPQRASAARRTPVVMGPRIRASNRGHGAPPSRTDLFLAISALDAEANSCRA